MSFEFSYFAILKVVVSRTFFGCLYFLQWPGAAKFNHPCKIRRIVPDRHTADAVSQGPNVLPVVYPMDESGNEEGRYSGCAGPLGRVGMRACFPLAIHSRSRSI